MPVRTPNVSEEAEKLLPCLLMGSYQKKWEFMFAQKMFTNV